MKKIAIIGASYLQLPLILKAKNLGYETHVFAWQCGDIGEEAANYFYPISIIEKEDILRECRRLKIDAICSIASDLAAITVNYIANALNLIGNSLECTLKCTNKYKMRECFFQHNVPSPMSILVKDIKELIDIEYTFPIIIKPSDRSGSRGITKLENAIGLSKAFLKAYKESFTKEVLIEEYVVGEEYSIECISYRGRHSYLATTKKHTTGAPHFIETGHEEPSGLEEALIEKVKNIIFHALDSLGIQNGASHSEVKIDSEGNIKIIEVGARMGGDCIGSHLVELSTGYDYLKMVIDIALGYEPCICKNNTGIGVEIRYIMNGEDLEKFKTLEVNNPSSILYNSRISKSIYEKVTDSSNRIGCYIIKKGEINE